MVIKIQILASEKMAKLSDSTDGNITSKGGS